MVERWVSPRIRHSFFPAVCQALTFLVFGSVKFEEYRLKPGVSSGGFVFASFFRRRAVENCLSWAFDSLWFCVLSGLSSAMR